MADEELELVLEGVVRLPALNRICIGIRTLKTLPMRLTERFGQHGGSL